jgi:DNA modification methylase
LKKFKENYFDMILTSPPYLNAIDYMRGHKFSLVWFGYKISELRDISSVSIGSERKIEVNKKYNHHELIKKFSKLHLNSQMIQRYFIDLCDQLTESHRVLKTNGLASFVIGNSVQKDKLIYNNKILKEAAKIAGFSFFSEVKREIPSNRRYMPINGNSSLSKRMKTEYVITFKKTKEPSHA